MQRLKKGDWVYHFADIPDHRGTVVKTFIRDRKAHCHIEWSHLNNQIIDYPESALVKLQNPQQEGKSAASYYAALTEG